MIEGVNITPAFRFGRGALNTGYIYYWHYV
jgi:hypothetical protein